MFAFFMILVMGANIYYAFNPGVFLPPWVHVVAAVLSFWAFLNALDD